MVKKRTEQMGRTRMEKIKTAAYCRVSTDKEVQEGSYEFQVSYFTDLIQSNPEMELAGVYGDKGRSGLYATGRPGLQKLMEDCRAGKINLILTKSISRFARNMAECTEMIRELQQFGIGIWFERENLNSQDKKASLILNIFSAIAQEESHSISLHTVQAHEQYALEGRPFGRISFGYKNCGDNKWVINEDEAPRVREAFRLAAEGKCYRDIQNTLNEMETDGYRWKQQRLKYLLTNVAYKGDYYSHKTVSIVPGKQVPNRGYRDRIYISEHHEPIISPDQFDFVQEIIEKGFLVSNRRRSKENKLFLNGETQNENSISLQPEGDTSVAKDLSYKKD